MAKKAKLRGPSAGKKRKGAPGLAAKRKAAKKRTAAKPSKGKRADYVLSLKTSRERTVQLLKFPIPGRKGKAALEIALDWHGKPQATVSLTRAEATKIRKDYGNRVRVQPVKIRYAAILRDLAKQGGKPKQFRAVVAQVGAVCMVPDSRLIRHVRGGQAFDVSCTAAQVKAAKAEYGALLQLTPIKASKKSA